MDDRLKSCSMCKQALSVQAFSKCAKQGTQSQCKECRSKHNKRVRIKRLSEGLCCDCNNIRIEGHPSFCEHHYIASVAQTNLKRSDTRIILELKNKLTQQNYLCPYTGEVLVLGKNTHLDHILLKSKYPEFVQDIENVEWVSRNINLAKSDMTKNEFINLCRTVAIKFSEI